VRSLDASDGFGRDVAEAQAHGDATGHANLHVYSR
jgi:hypothetical protein